MARQSRNAVFHEATARLADVEGSKETLVKHSDCSGQVPPRLVRAGTLDTVAGELMWL